MKSLTLIAIALLACTWSHVSQARDTAHYLPIEQALSAARASGKITDAVSFYFGDQTHPAVASDFGTFTTNKKTNAFGKSDETACEWAMQSALIELFNRAVREGANAVISIESFYKKKVYRDREKFECHAGTMVAGVTLRGTVVKLK